MGSGDGGKLLATSKGRDRPVENVSWDQCQEFLKRLNDRCKGLELKLPTETQWEYACRAGTDTPRYREDLDEIAWYGDNSNDETHPVGQKVPNDWGLFDTLGHVWDGGARDDLWTTGLPITKQQRPVHRCVRPPRDPGRLVVRRRAGRARGVPRPLRALGTGTSTWASRCAEFRARGPVGQKIAGSKEQRGSGAEGAEHPGDRDQASAAGWINLDAAPEWTACRSPR